MKQKSSRSTQLYNGSWIRINKWINYSAHFQQLQQDMEEAFHDMQRQNNEIVQGLHDLHAQLPHLLSQEQDFDIIPQIQLSDEALAQIPSTQITNEQVNDEAKCTICLTSFTLDETVWQLPCQHCYHSDCIAPWVKYHNSCPTCRAVVC